MNDESLNRTVRKFVGEAGDLKIAKAVECKGGLILLNSLSVQDEMIGGFGRTQVINVHGAVGIQDLSETQLNVGSSGAL